MSAHTAAAPSSLSGLRAACARLFIALVATVVLVGLAAWPRQAPAAPQDGPGGPILVVTEGASNFGHYYAEILRNEGFPAFAVIDIGALTPQALAAHQTVILAKTPLAGSHVTMLADWVSAGGNLIAMAPDAQLAGLLGLAGTGNTLSEGYLLVDTATAAGNGIVDQTVQFHGTADLYTLDGAASIATLFSDATTATSHPAVTLRDVGSGRAAAFTYDLATSVVLTRQGNPAWASQERDGFPPIRSNDKFFGGGQPDWVDLSKVTIPQADEQQRLLANLIVHMSLASEPLPRFWYFPHGKKAVVVMTGDDHGNGGTAARFDRFKQLSPQGCSLENWECVRGTSYIYAFTPLSDAQAAQYEAEGFEVGLHVNTGCSDFTPASLAADYEQQVNEWRAKYATVQGLHTQRHHCIVWSDWTTGAQVMLSHGMRLDTNYYYWPPGWVNNVPGLFTGSAMPMRYMALDGSFVDVYKAATQMTDESGQSYPFTVDQLLNRAVGPEGYYGAYTINAHTDADASPEAEAAVSAALARGVPVVSARQMLTWLDARNASSFQDIAWNGGSLTFTVTRAPAAIGLLAMVPVTTPAGVLGSLTRNGIAVPFSTEVVKGIHYAFFAADSGTYVATYAADTTVFGVTGTSPGAGATGVSVGAHVTATFSEAIDPSTVNINTFELRDAANNLVSASVGYDGITRTATLVPSAPLAGSTTYTATLRGGSTDPRVKDLGGNALAEDFTWSFTTEQGPPPPECPCTAWSDTTTPVNPSQSDPNPVELGVKFRVGVPGYITGIRFYKGSGNTGTHVGNLWTLGGTNLASATFQNETATGWQEVTFANPVAVAADTVYVASYFAPNGNYAGDSFFFASSGVDNGPVHLLSDAEGGGNGVYAYGSASSFPSQTWQATNYWVDIVFAVSLAPDTTPPTVTGATPADGATGVNTSTAVTATFSENIDPATVTASTFELRDGSSQLVPASVTYDPGSRTARLTPNALLAASTVHTATLKGGGFEPRIRDLAGNPLVSDVVWSFTTGTVAGPCAAPANKVVAENCLAGNPASEWDVSGAGDPSIQGFATDISANAGGTVSFKVDTTASAFRLDIYRMGYYGGMGARKVATVPSSATTPQNQPACLTDSATGLIDCGNWSVSATWNVPADATSGIYFAKAVREDTNGASHIVFVVREDGRNSDMLFQTADTTWQAYNTWGGNSLYVGSPAGRAYKVSYNRPFNTRSVDGGQDWLFATEYPMVRWLERNGYDVSYFTGVDTDRRGSLLLNHRVFLSVGHDEYWSAGQRANVEAARGQGVHMAFFSGNEVFWKTRWENSIDGSGATYRTLVCYKETHANAKIDPSPEWTGTWRDPRFSPPSDGGRPENALTGTLFMVNDGATTAIQVPEADGKMRFWRNTSIATLQSGQSATLPDGTLGYEWDVDPDNGFRPAGVIRLSTTTVPNAPVLQDFGSSYGSGTATHHLTLYRHASGALVFGAGTVQWSWGLDATHDRAGTPADARMQQATVNLFADMGVQPATLQADLVPGTPSTDTATPASTIASPADGASVAQNTTVTISGTAVDAGGGVVGGVEVSVDNGATWHPASGRANWTYSWTTPSANTTATIRSRAVDDSGNVEAPSAGALVTVGSGADTTPPTVTGITPASDATGVSATANATATFSEAMDATTINTNTFQLRDAQGTLVSATVSYNATSRVATLNPSPTLTQGATYTATVLSGASGVKDAAGNPMAADMAWSFTIAADVTAPTVTGIAPGNGATGVARNVNVRATFSENMDASTISGSTFELRDTLFGTVVPAVVTYDAARRRAILNPNSNLAALRNYTATVRGGATGVKDLAGNALANDRVWSFTTR